jgi:hypothetical protein
LAIAARAAPTASTASAAPVPAHDPVAHLWPDELATLQPLVNQNHPGLIPDQKLDPIRPLRSEDEGGSAERVSG